MSDEPLGMKVLRGRTVAYVMRLPAYHPPLIVCDDGTVVETGSWRVLLTRGQAIRGEREAFEEFRREQGLPPMIP